MMAGEVTAGERRWDHEGAGPVDAPFRPISLRVLDSRGRIVERVTSTEPFTIEFEYQLRGELTGLRVGLYLSTSRGEPVFTSFDTDASDRFETWTTRPAGRYVSRCHLPGDLLNGGTFFLGVNASAFRIQSFFTEERALTLSVDPTGSPGSHWAEARGGPLRPALAWDIAEAGG